MLRRSQFGFALCGIHQIAQGGEYRGAVPLLRLRERSHLGYFLFRQTELFLLDAPQDASGHQAQTGAAHRGVHAIDLLGLGQMLERRMVQTPACRGFEQEENRLKVHGPFAVPTIGHRFGVGARHLLRPIQPLGERFEMRIECDGAFVQGLRKQEVRLRSGRLALFCGDGFL